MKLTVPQRRALEFLAAQDHMAPRELARLMWPDSPGWSRRTRKFGGQDPGAMGGTMPMKAARLLWRLHSMGLAACEDFNCWRTTSKGREVLEKA